jgi:hypothetical protein
MLSHLERCFNLRLQMREFASERSQIAILQPGVDLAPLIA